MISQSSSTWVGPLTFLQGVCVLSLSALFQICNVLRHGLLMCKLWIIVSCYLIRSPVSWVCKQTVGFCTLEVAWQERILNGTGSTLMLSPNLRMTHPSATGYCGKADFEKDPGLNLQLAFGKLQTQCSQQLGRKQKHTVAEVQDSRGSPTKHPGHFGILSIPHSLVLLCMGKLLIHQATRSISC